MTSSILANSVPFGAILRDRRRARRYSQLQLAGLADVSQRHISFLETGRSHPSREMVVHLANVLDLPLRDRNILLTAAGFAPAYRETGLDEPAMDQVRHVLEFVLAAHEPFPTLVIDRRWDVVMSNDAASRLTAAIIDPATAPIDRGVNIARLTFHPDGLRTVMVGWDEVAASVLERLEREVVDRPGDRELGVLFEEMLTYPGVARLRRPPRLPSGDDLLLPVHYRSDDIEVRLLTTIATIGAPYDITLEELRLETFYPADSESEQVLRSLAEN